MSQPRPLGLADRIEVIAVPDVQPELQLRIAPLDDAVELPVHVFVAFDPEALPEHELRVAVEHAEELDERPVIEFLAALGPLEVVIRRLRTAILVRSMSMPRASARPQQCSQKQLGERPAMRLSSGLRRSLHHITPSIS